MDYTTVSDNENEQHYKNEEEHTTDDSNLNDNDKEFNRIESTRNTTETTTPTITTTNTNTNTNTIQGKLIDRKSSSITSSSDHSLRLPVVPLFPYNNKNDDYYQYTNNNDNKNNNKDNTDPSKIEAMLLLEGYPPPIIVWIYSTMDSICSVIVVCSDWRKYIITIDDDHHPNNNNNNNNNENNISSNDNRKNKESISSSSSSLVTMYMSSWLSEKNTLPTLESAVPPLLTYDDFYYNDYSHSFYDESSSSSSSIPPQQPPKQTLSTMITMYTDMNRLYQYTLTTPSTELGNLVSTTAIIVLIPLVILLRQIKSFVIHIFSSIGKKTLAVRDRRMINTNTNKNNNNNNNTNTTSTTTESDNNDIGTTETDIQQRAHKFGEYCFRMLYHTAMSVFGIYYFYKKSWWNNSIQFFDGYPYHEIESGMIWYYLLQCSYNIDAMISLLLLSFDVQFFSLSSSSKSNKDNINDINDSNNNKHSIITIPYIVSVSWKSTVRGDFNEMFLHHIATNGLVIGSSRIRLTRIGSIVFLIHDVSDIFVDCSKICHLLRYRFLTQINFIIMVLVWICTRLYLFPIHVWYGTYQNVHLCLRYGFPPLLYQYYKDLFLLGMGLLILLHTIWLLMFVKMLYSFILRREMHDYSEHKKGEPTITTTATSSAIATVTVTTNAINTTYYHDNSEESTIQSKKQQ